MNRDSVATVAVLLMAVACCLGLPILASVGVGATVMVLGLGLPLALVAVGVAWIAARRHRRLRPSHTATSTPETGPAFAAGPVQLQGGGPPLLAGMDPGISERG